jgi:hypothetical protein
MSKAGMTLKTPEDITDFFFCLHMAGLELLDHPEQLPDLDFQSTMRAVVKDFRKRFRGRKPYNVDFSGQELFSGIKRTKV